MNCKTNSLVAKVALFVFCFVFLSMSSGCKKPDEDQSTEEQVVVWLRRTPPVINPPLPKPEQLFYSSFEQWADAGSRIEGLEEVLLKFLKQGHREFSRRHLIMALGFIGSCKSEAAILEILQDELSDIPIRRAAAESLGELGSKQAVLPLCQLAISTNDRSLMLSALSALGLIGDPRAKPYVERILQEKKLTKFERKFVKHVLGEVSVVR